MFVNTRKPSLEVAPTTLATFSSWPHFELDLNSVKMNQHAKYLGQRSYSSQVTDGTHTRTHTHTHTHKPDRLLHHITMNSRVMMTTWNDYNYTVIPQRQISTTPSSVYLQCTHVGRSTQSVGTTKICGTQRAREARSSYILSHDKSDLQCEIFTLPDCCCFYRATQLC